MSHIINTRNNLKRQQGVSTLLISILLLLIMTVIVGFAFSVGFFEQRTTTNENRAKMAQQAAEVGLSQGIEYMKANSTRLTRAWLYSVPAGGVARWVRCARTETTFPCGTETNLDRRERSYKYFYSVTGHTDDAATTDVDERAIMDFSETLGTGVTQSVTTMGAFNVDYDVGALLCLRTTTNGCDCRTSDGSVCTLDPGTQFAGSIAITVVSRSRLAAESTATASDAEQATATVKAVVATYRTIQAPPDVPITASGYINGSGNADVVPNPNGAGRRIAVSIWSPANVDITSGGSFDTCHKGEFFASGTPTMYQNIQTCSDCRCQNLPWGEGKLTGHTGPTFHEGPDVLDVDGNTGETSDSQYFPTHPADSATNPLDDSLFEYIFGADVTNEDGTAIAGAEVAYLTQNAKVITSCASLNSSAAGLYWYTGTAECSLGGDVGTPDNPVALVSNTAFSLNNARVFGMLFQRRTSPVSDFTANGGVEVYGAAIIDGPVVLRGQPAFIYQEEVLKNLANSPAFTRFGVVPGSWSDLDTF